MFGTSFLNFLCPAVISKIDRCDIFNSLTVTEIRKAYQSVPRIFVQKSHCHVERGASPAFQGKCIGVGVTCVLRNSNQIGCADSGGQEGLMGITPGGIHEKGALVVVDGFCESFGTVLHQNVPPSSLTRSGDIDELAFRIVQVRENDIALEFRLSNLALDAATVDGNISEIGQKLLGAVLGLHQGEKGRPAETRQC